MGVGDVEDGGEMEARGRGIGGMRRWGFRSELEEAVWEIYFCGAGGQFQRFLTLQGGLPEETSWGPG